MKVLPIIALVFMLTACGGDSQTVTFAWEKARLEYSFPYDGQREVSVNSPIILRFSDPLAADVDLSGITLRNSLDEVHATTAELLADRRSVILTPADPLHAVQQYHLALSGLASEQLGEVEVPQGGVQFTTRALRRGARDQQWLAEEFYVTRVLPDGDSLPLMDFSTLRVQFSQMLDLDSVRYGIDPDDTVALVNDAGELVPARVYAGDSYLTVDPIEDLIAGEEYQLLSVGGLKSVSGIELVSTELAFVAEDSQPRTILVQRADDSNNGQLRSELSGAAINAVPVKALLLGQDSVSQQQGEVRAELAFVPNFPDSSPLRVPLGSLLAGSAVSVDIAGEVPAGFDTGAISVTFISDAVGFLLPNPYTSNPDSPRHVQLLMDIAMTAQTPQANGALSQNLLHVELYGTAIVENGSLVINALGVVEPEVLGLETAWGLLSFNMRALEDQVNVPPAAVDIDPPILQSWLPGENRDMVTPGEPIIVNFSEPLDVASIDQAGAIALTRNGIPEPFRARLDGASLVIGPATPLAQPRPGLPANYQLVLDAPLRDLAGNLVDQRYQLDFSLPTFVDADTRSPLPLTVYPGYSCETSGRNISLDGAPSAAEHHGRCVGGQGGDDLLPLSRLPANRPIRVQFSQDMDLASMQLGGSVRVQRRDAGAWVDVAGDLRVSARLLEFWPQQSWQTDQLYRYQLLSNNDRSSAAGTVCDGTQAICSAAGLPLQTRWLTQDYREATAQQGGGPTLTVLFRGAPATSAVMQALRNLPSTDVNANMIHEAPTEPWPTALPGGGFEVPFNSTNIVTRNPSASGLLFLEANVGCGFTRPNIFVAWSPINCPERRFIYLTGALNSDVVGFDQAEQAVQVDIWPSVIHTSNLDVVVNAILLGPQEAPTGPQVMRMRYRFNPDSGRRDLPVTGWIRETENGPELEATLDLYLDAPELHADALGITLSHNQLSLPLTMTVRGPIHFLDDGRMHIVQTNVDPVDISVVVGGNNLNLRIPAEGANLSFISEAVKR